MSIFTIVLMAIGLAMDCFAVSVCKGLTSPHGYVPRYVKPILMALLFGLFHAFDWLFRRQFLCFIL